MPPTTLSPEVLSAIIAGAVSILVSSLVSAWMLRKKLESDYDVTLRTERLAEYRKLWELIEPLGWYGNHEITADSAKQLRAKLDHWYFENGAGILMSDLSVHIFEELMVALEIFDNNSKELRKIGTRLRAAMAYDIGGRNLPLLRRRPREQELDKKNLYRKDPTEY